jgi:hypothetical protein
MMTMTVICSYFKFVSKEWHGLMLTATLVGTLSYLCVLIILPESPLKLLGQGDETKARETINFIAWFNGSPKRFQDPREKILSKLLTTSENCSRESSIMSDEGYELLDLTNLTPSKVAQDGKYTITLVLLNLILVATNVASWITLLMMSALPGPNKLSNGIILGVSETLSSFVTGYILNFCDDRQAGILLSTLCIVFNLAYRVLGAGNGGITSLGCLFLAVGGLGGL